VPSALPGPAAAVPCAAGVGPRAVDGPAATPITQIGVWRGQWRHSLLAAQIESLFVSRGSVRLFRGAWGGLWALWRGI